jgi:hypothetical protein
MFLDAASEHTYVARGLRRMFDQRIHARPSAPGAVADVRHGVPRSCQHVRTPLYCRDLEGSGLVSSRQGVRQRRVRGLVSSRQACDSRIQAEQSSLPCALGRKTREHRLLIN